MSPPGSNQLARRFAHRHRHLDRALSWVGDRHEAIQAMRKRQDTPEWRALYGARTAGIEGCLSQGIPLCGLRRSRYVGLAKTHLQHVATAAALNVARLDAWLRGRPRAATRTSRFVQLMAA